MFPTPPTIMEVKLTEVQQQLSDLTFGHTKKTFSLEEVCTYHFDRSLPMIAFPQNFTIPKFDKYKGKGDPKDHLREFYLACFEVSHNDTYLMHLFPCSLRGQAIEWSHLPTGIKLFNELAEKFATHFSYNAEHEISMTDLCNNKQKMEKLSFLFFNDGDIWLANSHSRYQKNSLLAYLCRTSTKS